MNTQQLLSIAHEAVLEKKGHQPVLLDLTNISGVTDYFLICSAQTPVQVRAIADNVSTRLAEAGHITPLKEGNQEARWILLDYGVLVVHVMNQTERDFYALEHLWHDAKVVELTV